MGEYYAYLPGLQPLCRATARQTLPREAPLLVGRGTRSGRKKVCQRPADLTSWRRSIAKVIGQKLQIAVPDRSLHGRYVGGAPTSAMTPTFSRIEQLIIFGIIKHVRPLSR